MEALKQNEVEDAVVVEDVAGSPESKTDTTNTHRELLLTHLTRWEKELAELSKLLTESKDEVLADYMYKVQCVIGALDKEAVYLSHLAGVAAEQLKEKEDAKPAD